MFGKLGNSYIWLNRCDVQSPNHTISSGTHSGHMVICAASGLGNYTEVEIRVRKLRLVIASVAFDPGIYPISYGTLHSDNIYGDPSNLSDERIKTDEQLVS